MVCRRSFRYRPRVATLTDTGFKFGLQVQFHQEADYPVDLYYLMDLSASMRDDKDKLALLGVELAQKMQEITKDFRLGFGSFVDKTVSALIRNCENTARETALTRIFD